MIVGILSNVSQYKIKMCQNILARVYRKLTFWYLTNQIHHHKQNVNKRCYFITITGILQGIGEEKKGCFTHKKENNKNKRDK